VVACRHDHTCKTKTLAEPVAHRSPALVSATQPNRTTDEQINDMADREQRVVVTKDAD